MYKNFLVFVGILLLMSCKKSEEEVITNDYELTYPAYFGTPDLPESELDKEQVELGRLLFYERKLSRDSSVSCSSCHIQKFGFSDTTKFSLGVDGRITNRNSMALSNLIWQKAFFWDGRVTSLEDQALLPIENPQEMDLPLDQALARLNSSENYRTLFKNAFGSEKINPRNLAKAISSFERTLITGNSRYDEYKQGRGSLTDQEIRGEALFLTHPEPSQNLRGGNCGDCHSFPHLQGFEFKNNGLDEVIIDEGRKDFTGREIDAGKFKIPNLRNIELTAPYMHDGRFKTLEEVLSHYNEHINYNSPNLDPLITSASNDCIGCDLGLTETEKQDIIAFLKTLTDNKFITNEKFSKPKNN